MIFNAYEYSTASGAPISPAAQSESQIKDARLFSKRVAICRPRHRMKVKSGGV